MAHIFSGSTQYWDGALDSITEPITMACWFYPTADGGGVLMSAGVNAGTSRWELSHGYTGVRKLSIISYTAAGSSAGVDATSLYTSNSGWYHACAVCSASNSRTIYLNGGSAQTSTSNVTVSGIDRMTIGAKIAGGVRGAFAKAYIVDAAVWNVALTAAEIATLVNKFAAKYVRPQNLVFYAPLLRDVINIKGASMTNTGPTTQTDHPRLFL